MSCVYRHGLSEQLGRIKDAVQIMKPVVRQSWFQRAFMEVYKSLGQERMRPARTAHGDAPAESGHTFSIPVSQTLLISTVLGPVKKYIYLTTICTVLIRHDLCASNRK